MRKIGILGGTFDPIHMGHLMLAEWAKSELELDEIWLIPNGVSRMKEELDPAPAEDRYAMTQLAVKGNEQFKCLDLEIKREGYTYSFETLEELSEAYPEDILYFILGSDCLHTIESWKSPERFFRCCKLVAAVRDDSSMDEMKAKKEELIQRFGGEIILLPFARLSISSTVIRERIKEGKSVRYMIPDSVLVYITKKGLYR